MAADRITWRYWEGGLPQDGGDWPEREAFNAVSARSLSEQLTTVRFAGPLALGDLPLICVVRNERARLPLFFRHYRELGVTRFLMIDNGSSDGTRELLLAQDGVDVLDARASFRDSYCGAYWTNALAHAHCRGRWVLRADADELLVYDGMESHPLPDLARLLDATGFDRLYAPMLDLYSSAAFAGGERGIEQIFAGDSWFDSEGYELARWKEGWYLTGGPRARLFNREGKQNYSHWLSKYPFFHMDAAKALFNPHYMWPFDQVTKGPMAALLHLKLFDDFPERSATFAREKRHAHHSLAYRLYNEVMREQASMSAMHAQSRRYRGPKSLLRHRMMLPLDWSKLPKADLG